MAWLPQRTWRAPAGVSLVLERRPVLGGAAVTEEIFPGFKFSVFSYVVSLLRPEIVRDLELPRHGLQILPLESTVTPLDNGDYLASWADPDETRREICRHSPRDAEAAIQFGRLMHAHGDGGEADPRHGAARSHLACSIGSCAGCSSSAGTFSSLGPENFHALCKLMTMSSADYLDEWYRVRSAQGDEVGERHHRHVPRPALARYCLRAAAPLHGRDRRRVPRVGISEGRHRRSECRDRERCPRVRRRDFGRTQLSRG